MRPNIVITRFSLWPPKPFVQCPPAISACLPASDIVQRCSLMLLCLLKACTWYEDIHTPGKNDGTSAIVLEAIMVLNTWLKVGMHVHDFDIKNKLIRSSYVYTYISFMFDASCCQAMHLSQWGMLYGMFTGEWLEFPSFRISVSNFVGCAFHMQLSGSLLIFVVKSQILYLSWFVTPKYWSRAGVSKHITGLQFLDFCRCFRTFFHRKN